MNKHDPVRTAKVFWSGRSQAVRLPSQFRFNTDEVTIRREGEKVILQPKPASGAAHDEDEWAWLDRLSGDVDPDFEAAALEEMPWGPEDPESKLEK